MDLANVYRLMRELEELDRIHTDNASIVLGKLETVYRQKWFRYIPDGEMSLDSLAEYLDPWMDKVTVTPLIKDKTIVFDILWK